MIQLNLLPDVKLEYIKTRRIKRLVMLVATIVTGASVAILVLLFVATNILQRQHMSNLRTDIEDKSQELEEQEDLNKILTVQNQLNVLDELHAQKPAAGRLGRYLGQVVPSGISIAKFEADFSVHTISFEGSAASLSVVNQFIDTLKFTTFTADDETGDAFSNVVLANFQRTDGTQSESEDPVSYEITLSFNPIVFDNTLNVRLAIPEAITTQSADRPDPNTLFQDNNGNGGQ